MTLLQNWGLAFQQLTDRLPSVQKGYLLNAWNDAEATISCFYLGENPNGKAFGMHVAGQTGPPCLVCNCICSRSRCELTLRKIDVRHAVIATIDKPIGMADERSIVSHL